MDNNKNIFVFAGPNGSGKSSLYDDLEKYGIPQYYITPDNIVAKEDRENTEKYIAAMQEAESLRIKAVEQGVSFTFETVFSRADKLDFLKEAKSLGYLITIIYITTSDYNINIKRVEERKRSGGHGVPQDKIISRYEKSMTLLPNMIEVADVIKVYDNSAKPVLVFEKTHENKMILHNREQRHSWVEKYIKEPLAEKGISEILDFTYFETKEYLENNEL